MTTYLERFSDVAKRLVSTTGQEALYGLSPELMLTACIEMDRPEWAALGGTKLLMLSGGSFVAGGAGNANQLLISSSSPGLMTVVTAVLALGQSVKMGIFSGTGFSAAIAGGVKFRDARLTGSPGTTIHSKVNVGQSMNTQSAITVPAGVWVPVSFVQVTGAPKAQGTILIENQTLNTTLEVYMLGYERNADAHEFDSTVS